MNRRQKIIVSVVGIFIVLLALIGLTYAYFLTRIEGNTNTTSISVNTADLKLVYSDGTTQVITGDKIMPNTVIGEKDFTVTNEGNNTSYVVVIDGNGDISDGITPVDVKYATSGTTRSGVSYNAGDSTTFVSNDFVYTLTCTSNIEGNTCNQQNFETSLPMNGGVIVGNNIAEEEVHTYTLKVAYLETNEDQTDDMNKTFNAQVNIVDIRSLNPYSDNKSSLAYNIINNSMLNKNGTKLLNTSSTKVAEEKSYTKGTGKMVEQELDLNKQREWYYGSTYGDAQPGNGGSVEGVVSTCSDTIVNKYISYSGVGESWYVKSCKSETIAVVGVEEMEYESSIQTAQDDLGTSYYYRGNVEDNYVTFAGMCWRIVRIDGNGNTKLILEDQDEVCSTTMNGNWDIEASDGTNITTDGTNPYRTGNFGYDDSTGKYKMSYLNPVDNPNRAMVNAFKYFQTNTLTNKITSTYTGKTISDFLVSGNWCLNNKAYSDIIGTTLLENPTYSSEFYYDSYVRLYRKTTKEPTLKCLVETMETFGDNTTPMYVGTLTADEIVYAGGIVGLYNQNYYLINKRQNSNSKYFWALSPYYFNGHHDNAFNVSSKGNLDYHDVSYYSAFRPSVSLASSAVITSGEGTLESPYVIG